jgi:hypothetical protein
MVRKRNKKRLPKSIRTMLFKKRMIEIIHLLLNDSDTRCYFCGKHFLKVDFPIDKSDNINIHHTSYIPEIKVLAHTKCHRKFHAEQKKKSL